MCFSLLVVLLTSFYFLLFFPFRYHDNMRMHSKGKNYIITNSGTLRFTEVQVIDRGEYYCKIENEYKEQKQSNPAILTVHGKNDDNNGKYLYGTYL